MDLYLIAAVTSDLGIAHQGSVPWDLPGDMKHFKKITTQTSDPTKRNAVLMGRKTWYGLDSQHRPLSGRLNIVLSRHFQISETEDTKCCRSMQEALKLLARSSDIEKVFVIGGASVFKQCIRMSACKRLYLTEISSTFQCDTFFPKFDRKVFRPISLPEIDEEVQKEGGVEYHFVCYQRKPNALLQLLNRFFQ